MTWGVGEVEHSTMGRILELFRLSHDGGSLSLRDTHCRGPLSSRANVERLGAKMLKYTYSKSNNVVVNAIVVDS